MSSPHRPTLPAFLRQSKSDIHAKFVDLEWQQRDRLLRGTQPPANGAGPSPWSRLAGDATASRNRYLNVEPYAVNRVRLRVADGLNDYINASHIALGRRQYIATQGPKGTNVNHFYRMLAAEVKSPAVVVMLTQTHESGKEKCFQYYPLEVGESPMGLGVEDGWGGEVVLEEVREDVETRCQVRRMRLKARSFPVGQAEAGAEEDIPPESQEGEAHELEINHLLFSGWPDFLIPEGDDRAALVKLVSLSEFLNSQPHYQETKTSPGTFERSPPDQSNPRIVHCSAGVGRSGTFIALDHLLSQLHAGELDNLEPDRDPIAETVDLLRQQRMMMVQGESQFSFLYELMREAVEERQREK